MGCLQPIADEGRSRQEGHSRRGGFMKHPPSCENAKMPVCQCGECGGSLHGWPSALILTSPDKAPERAVIRATAEQAWTEATTTGRSILRRYRGYRDRRKAKAAVKSAKADVIDWLAATLAAPPSTAGAAESQLVQPLGDLVSTKVFAALCEAVGEHDRKARREFAKNHLFCSLLASTACAMQQVSDDLSNFTTQVAGRLVTYMIRDTQVQNPPLLTQVATDALAKGMNGLVSNLPVVQQFSQLQRAAQILALLMC